MPRTGEPIALRLQALWRRLAASEVDAYLLPTSDTHLNEYAPAYLQRRAAISGFSGSAGDLLLSPDQSHLFVDSRYHVQAEQEVDPALFRVHKLGLQGAFTLSGWLTELEQQRDGLKVGYDPFTLSMETHAAYTSALQHDASDLVALPTNLVDEVWESRPNPPGQPIYLLPDACTGRSVADKLAALRKEMQDAGAEVLILTRLDEIAWLTNLRGSDVDFNPVFEAYMIIDHQRARCFTRVPPSQECRAARSPALDFQPYNAYLDAVRELGADAHMTIWLDPAGTTMGTRLLLPDAQSLHTEPNPLPLMKAIKNAAEIASSRNAHLRAAAAKIRSLARLDRLLGCGRTVSERQYADLLHEEYSSEAGFCDLSFRTIAAAGPNAAIVHYSDASPEVLLRSGDLLLVDSGVQIIGGTTDDTRTICIGTPSARQRQLYTLVLRCHIRLACQQFPEGTHGQMLDTLTRGLMWNAGLDYGHGTGHGVGAFLNVHEGPQRLAARGSDTALQDGMIVSNEPGYYETGWGGIRLENLYVVRTNEALPTHPSGKGWLRLEPLTLIPFDTRLLDWEQLTAAELAWLQDYHQQVWETIGPLLNETDRAWLQQACSLP